MKRVIYLFLLSFLFLSKTSTAQIRNVIVEKYYVSDSLDATDSINYQTNPSYASPFLPVGSITYRVYVQVDSGYKIHKIYGTSCHPLEFLSTANFFNHIYYSTYYFGYLIPKSRFSSKPTIALDSWLTLGSAAVGTVGTSYTGVLKSEDFDGSFIGGTHNSGGTSGIAGGIIRNNDTAAGVPVDTSDGMVPTNEILGTWSNSGFIDVTQSGSPDTTVFGNSRVGSQFRSTIGYLQQNNGVSGNAATGHKVLVAQLTTKGQLTFKINLELVDSTGGVNTGHYLNYVASAGICDSVGRDTTVLGILKFPPDAQQCGCQDPNFLEYNASLQCASQDSCHTRIVFGCMDTLACNYDPNANYHIQNLCCYPGKCNDRDISLVCPGISSQSGFSLYPNPASNSLTLQISAGTNQEIKYEIYDSFGTLVLTRELGTLSGTTTNEVDVSNLHIGLYMARVYVGGVPTSKSFMKN